MGLLENIYEDRVSNLKFYRNPVLVSPSASVRSVVEKLQQSKRGCVFVCDNDQLVGIFTERDLLLRVFGGQQDLDLPVEKYMTPDPLSVKTDAIVAQVMKDMRKGGHRHLPVVDQEGKPIGELSVKHIVHYLVDHFPEEIYNLPPDPDETLPTREGA